MNWETGKHVLHCIALYAWIAIVITFSMLPVNQHGKIIDPINRYGIAGTIVLYIVKCLPFLVIHQCIFQLIGLTFYNPFKQTVLLKSVPTRLSPLVCFRIVTRGLYPRLVKDNLILNIDTCQRAGIINFKYEVVTDNAINLLPSHLVREVIVPDTYKSKNGALFKARALQYCIEEGVNNLRDSDWIVHMDEETLLTTNAVKGILNFVTEGKHDLGQGLITYASGVADDCGKLRAQLSLLHKPIFGWKGSYVVARVGAERTITWDHGPEGSIAEDTYFGFLAMQAGYSFDFIEGEMLEKSPFTTIDFVQQRKRWLEGLLLVVHSMKIGILWKIPMSLVVYSWVLTPLTFAQFILGIVFPLPTNYVIDSFLAFSLALNIYMNVFGVIRSFTGEKANSIPMILLYCIGSCLTLPYTVIVQVVSVILFVCTPKKKFHIVKKEATQELDSTIV